MVLSYFVPLQSSILNPLDKDQFPNYDQFVINHIDLTTLQNNVTDQKYHSTESFQADVSWMVHNATIYPGEYWQSSML